MCPPIWAHWRNLANTVELVLPSAHASPQPQTTNRSGLAVSAQLTAESPYTLQWDVCLWSPYVIGQTIIFLPCDFYLLLSFFFLFSPNLSRHRLDVCHTSTHGVALVRI